MARATFRTLYDDGIMKKKNKKNSKKTKKKCNVNINSDIWCEMTGMNDAAYSRSMQKYADNIIIKFWTGLLCSDYYFVEHFCLLTIPLLNKLLFSLREPQGALLC